MIPSVDADFFVRLTQANEEFRSGLPATLERLRQAGASFDPALPALQLAGQLQSLLHTLAGAAVTFGFRELGQGARAGTACARTDRGRARRRRRLASLALGAGRFCP